ncbi:hypothetical protein [Candidatus Mycoplasma haematominutum]|uniref:Uncharacterized protein n=1 Tax=Candidatus Mycoplasma haematominutum 'Birmingham 1' TaxID=1116213 RepID=G8C3V8_9MOLU|nr:hypothetical protein [Candidatus Mycoplasma haematominutum]CCE67006.1 conserved haemoplasma hypothetical protein [Candidatus Mycoplasma haematominutum 'Birmingham 1']
MTKAPKKVLLPDTFSFVQESVDEFFGKIHNEFNLSLKDAIKEFTEFHVSQCNFLGFQNETKDLSLYYHFNYAPEKDLATLEKVYFVSPEAKHILMYNYLLEVEAYLNSRSKSHGRKLSKSKSESTKLFEFEEKFKGLTFFADYNNLEIFEAKKLLLNYSYLRDKNKQLLLLKNLNKNYENNMLTEAIIKFDLTFLERSSFFCNERYSGFKKILPPNLMIDLPISFDYDLVDVPDTLRKEQLIDLNSLKMNISQ